MSTSIPSRSRQLLLLAGFAATILVGGPVFSSAAARSHADDNPLTGSSQPNQNAIARDLEAARRDEELARAAAARAAKAAPGTTAPAASSPFGSADVKLPVVSIAFPGGSVNDYIQMLRTSASDPVNIAASEELLSTQIPPIELKNVTLMSALRALGTIGDGAGMIDVRDLSMVGRAGDRVGSPLYEVMWVPRRASEEQAVTTYSLFDRLPSVSDEEATRMAETLVSAAQTALQMSGSNTTWDLKFHRPSRLLLVKGNKSQLDVVSGVVERMSAAWARDAIQKASSNSGAESVERLQRFKSELSKDIEAHRAQMENYMRNFEERAEVAKKNGAAVPEMSQVERMRYSALQDSYQAKLTRLNRLEDQLLASRLGGEGENSLHARLDSLEARLNELSAQMSKIMGR